MVFQEDDLVLIKEAPLGSTVYTVHNKDKNLIRSYDNKYYKIIDYKFGPASVTVQTEDGKRIGLNNDRKVIVVQDNFEELE